MVVFLAFVHWDNSILELLTILLTMSFKIQFCLSCFKFSDGEQAFYSRA